MYNKVEKHNDMIYSVDMLRLKAYMSYNIYSQIEFTINTAWKNLVKKSYIGTQKKEFRYNYVIEVEEGCSFWFGYIHNTENLSVDVSNYDEYNFTIEFNPNKLKDNRIIMYILHKCAKWFIKSLDLAVDIDINILDIIVDMSGRQEIKTIGRGFDNKTYYLGKGDGRVKIYNKKIESNLNILGNLTRIEISKEFDDFPVRNIKLFKFDDIFPHLYTQRYVYSFDDLLNDRTVSALLYAVQNGFPLKNLTKTYRAKVKNLLENGSKIKFNCSCASQVVRSTILYYFYKNDNVHFL